MNVNKFALNYELSNDSNEESLEDNDDEKEEPVNDEMPSSDENSESEEYDESDLDEKSNAKILLNNRPKPKFTQKSELDDKFFKESDMEEFIELEEKRQMENNPESDNEIDYFNGNFSDEDNTDNDDDDGGSNDAKKAMYNDFFDQEIDENDEEHIEHKKQMKKSVREERNKLKEKLKKKDLGIEDSDIDENDDYNEDETDGKVRFDLSQNSYISASDDGNNDDDDDNSSRQEETIETPAVNSEPEIKSSFEQRQERLRLRINDLEEKALGEKSWQLKGEIDSTSRPQNSLLEEVLQFEQTTRPAPIITEETTLKLEDIIKQRIKDKAWNDVELKFKPTNTPQEFRKKLVLDQEKSKESLAQIYEKEYTKEIDKQDPNAQDKDEEEPQAHKDIRKAMQSLFIKLDALSNFFYTPKPVLPDAKIITNTPAINMEEVAPIAASDAMLLAPEEIKSRSKGDLIGKSERSTSDKNRERRHKKNKQKIHKVAKEKRDQEREKAGIKSSAKRENGKLLEKVTKSRNINKVICLY